MEEPKSLDSIFKEKILRIPDYQRGYAWQKDQLKDFWEDLINLSEKRNHYTGVLTLKEIDSTNIKEDDNEFWLVDDYSYKTYHVVDGQQRLTTFIIFIQSFIEFFEQLPENLGQNHETVYVTDSLNLSAIKEKYLYKTKPTGDRYRTYKFAYTSDNPSYEYLRYKIFEEEGAGTLIETFYTLNLRNAKTYFIEQMKEFYQDEGRSGIQDIFRKLTKRFLFNEYIIKDEFDVFVAFETMNNRGKKLSDLELLKNRLIYLTTLYADSELDKAEQKSLRDSINDSWKEVYYQLGRNEKNPLNDDEFLKAHWIIYFKYSRKRGNDYIKFLLDEQFSPQKIHKRIESDIKLDTTEELKNDIDMEDDENVMNDEMTTISEARLKPDEIKRYVVSLKESASHWFSTFFPFIVPNLSVQEKQAIDRLNRAGMGYFRPLVMSIFKNIKDPSERVLLFEKIERFIFISFHLSQARRNYKDSEFLNVARELDQKQVRSIEIIKKLESAMSFSFTEEGIFKETDFYNYLSKKFNEGDQLGYYRWHGLSYFLFEYECSLLSESRQQKVSWDDLLKRPKDKISIEHIYPQTPNCDYWQNNFSSIGEEQKSFYQGSIGNLLLLSSSINSAFQNDSFPDKKNVKKDSDGKLVRNAYSDGSHSEIEVSQYPEWNPASIKERGMKLLSFMEKRWEFSFESVASKEKLLFIPK